MSLFTYNAHLAAAAASPLMTESAEALASASVWAGLGLGLLVLIIMAMHVIASIKELAQTRRFQGLAEDDVEEVIECVGLESLSAEEYLELEELEFVQAETAHVEIIDNVVWLQCGAPEECIVPMEQDGVSVRENVQMAIWSCRRGFRSMVKFVKDLAAAPARIRELEAEIAKLKEEKNFDFDYYSDEEDQEVVTWVNKA